MNDKKNYLDGIKSPVQKKSIKDIPVPSRKNNRISPDSVHSHKKNLDLREEVKR
jgi:hypothetical protein